MNNEENDKNKLESDTFVVNVEGAIYKGEQWLMIVRSVKESHAGGTLAMPGGTVEHNDISNEVLENALRREILKEVGVTVGHTFVYVESKSFVTKNGDIVIDIVFMVEYVSGKPVAINSDEVESVKWMSLDEIKIHPKTPPWTLQSMQLAEEKLKKIIKKKI